MRKQIAVTALAMITASVLMSGCASVPMPSGDLTGMQEETNHLKEWREKLYGDMAQWKQMPEGPEKEKMLAKKVAEEKAYNEAVREHNAEIDHRLMMINQTIDTMSRSRAADALSKPAEINVHVDSPYYDSPYYYMPPTPLFY